MKLKSILIICIILSIISIGAVSASENITDDLAADSENVDEIAESSVDELISEENDDECLKLDENDDESLELDESDFDYYYENLISSVDDEFLDVEIMDDKVNGTFYVYVGDVDDVEEYSTSKDKFSLSFNDLGISESDDYYITLKFVSTDNEEITLMDDVEITLDVPEPDLYIYDVNLGDVDDNEIAHVYDEECINGMITLTINGKTVYSKNFVNYDKSSVYIYLKDLTSSEFNKVGTYSAKLTYNSYEEQDTIKMYYSPDVFYVPDGMSVGENEGIIIRGNSGIGGTLTVYNAKKEYDEDLEDYVYKKGSVFATAQIINGFARIPLDKLSEGEHNFIINYTFGGYSGETDDTIYVEKNSPQISSSVSSTSITEGNAITVSLAAPKSDCYVYIYLDGERFKEVKLLTGSIQEIISGLSAGTHYISIKYDDYDNDLQYSNTYVVTVNKVIPPAPAKVNKVKLALKKVKVKKSAKKLIIKATLKINGKKVKGKKVTLKFNGKKFKATTNKKGVATFKISKKVLKKLKAGKKIKYQASYGKKTAKRTVKVKK